MFENWSQKATSADEAVRAVRNGMRLFVHGAATPDAAARRPRPPHGSCPRHDLSLAYVRGRRRSLRRNTRGFLSGLLFTGPPLRSAVQDGRALNSCRCSRTSHRSSVGLIPIDVAFLPGSCRRRTVTATARYLGRRRACGLATAKTVVAKINQQMPRTHGNTLVPVSSRVSAFIATDRPLHAHDAVDVGQVEDQIGAHVARLVPDGATLQMGIGAIPDAVLRRLGDKSILASTPRCSPTV